MDKKKSQRTDPLVASSIARLHNMTWVMSLSQTGSECTPSQKSMTHLFQPADQYVIACLKCLSLWGCDMTMIWLHRSLLENVPNLGPMIVQRPGVSCHIHVQVPCRSIIDLLSKEVAMGNGWGSPYEQQGESCSFGV